MQKKFFTLSNDSFRGSLWAFLYALLTVLICPVMLDGGVSRYVVATAALVGIPALVSLALGWAKRSAIEKQ